MALSSNEHNLLVSACDNMNNAAGTCREVLEMLRNLGNTGVVDIATHNNASSAHTSDPTIARIRNSGDAFYLSIGESTYSGWGGMTSYPATLRCIADHNNLPSLVFSSKTEGDSAVNQAYVRTDAFLTDSSGNRTAFGDYNQSKLFYQNLSLISAYLRDVDSKVLTWAIKFTIGRSSGHGDTEDVTVSPYTNIQFWISNSLTTNVCPFSIDKDGFFPGLNNTYSIGSATRALKDVFVHNAVTVTSDRREKTEVSSLGSEAVNFIKALRPVGFKLVEGEGKVEQFNVEDDSPADTIPAKAGTRIHWGLIAQEVKEALSSAGIEDAAVWCLADKNDADSKQALRYEELIAPMIKVIQQQQERIEALERKVA